MIEPSLGMIELKSVARGIVAVDALVKKAPSRLLETHPVCPGKYMALFCGEVADVEESLKAGVEAGGDSVINSFILPYLHRSIIPAISGTTNIKNFGAVGIVETFSVASCVVAADVAAKATAVEMVEIRLAAGLGGKGYFVMTGSQSDIEGALEAAIEFAKEDGMLAGAEIIESPHPDLIEKGIYW